MGVEPLVLIFSGPLPLSYTAVTPRASLQSDANNREVGALNENSFALAINDCGNSLSSSPLFIRLLWRFFRKSARSRGKGSHFDLASPYQKG